MVFDGPNTARMICEAAVRVRLPTHSIFISGMNRYSSVAAYHFTCVQVGCRVLMQSSSGGGNLNLPCDEALPPNVFTIGKYASQFYREFLVCTRLFSRRA